ncbi:MAG: SpoIID/LytB domain-containing protein [bacterium]|jgi:hypothetical protein|nr:SpoIID/LytB domain-containing protein [bacterium]
MTHTLLKETRAVFSRAAMRSLVLISFLLISGGIFLSPTIAEAAPRRGYEALQVTAPKQGFTMAPGETQEVLITFQNIGEKAWVNDMSGDHPYISVYTYDPKYRVSDFRADAWEDYSQAAVLEESNVSVGGTGSVYLSLKAPLSPGTYEETFKMAAEETTWVPGGEFTLSIVVEGSQVADEEVTTNDSSSEEIVEVVELTPGVADGEASPVSTDGLSAMVLLRSAKNVTAEGGETIQYKVGVKNTGTVTWGSREIRSSDISIASVSTEHSSWVSSTQLVVNDAGTVTPGGLEFFDFTFTAPSTRGSHTVRFYLAVNDTTIPDFYIDIPVDVTSGAAEVIDAPVTVDENDIQASVLIEEPIVRIGLLTIDEETDWVTEISCDTQWHLEDSEGGLLGQMEADASVRAFYKNERYYFNRGRGIEETHKFLRFVPQDEDAICTIENFDRRETRGAAYAFNSFRDTLELQYIPYKDEVWVINEVPIEEYLYGLGETSNYSHEEFKKSLLTIARTYALYHWERNTKHRGYFHMNAYADDQVYFGEEYERVHYLIKEAVEETRGVTVNYKGETAITPYFSRSDGRTRNWSEVWGGYVPWVVGVPAPCDAEKGYVLWGHGVGMSATEALCMAKNGTEWNDILHYFYTDIDLNRRWN